MLWIGSYMRFNSILLFTFPAIDIKVIHLKTFTRAEAFLWIVMMMFSRHCLGVFFWYRTVFVIWTITECEKSPPYFKGSTVIAASEPDNLLLVIDFIVIMSSSFVKFDIFIFSLVVLLEYLIYLLDHKNYLKTLQNIFSFLLLIHNHLLENVRFIIHVCCAACVAAFWASTHFCCW